MKKLLALVPLALLASGCATVPPEFSYSGNDASCIKGGAANVLKFVTQSETHVFVSEIDGKPVPYNSACFTPGKHTVAIFSQYPFSMAGIPDKFEFQFEPGRKYRVDANIHSDRFQYRLLDITSDDAQVQFERTVRLPKEN